MGEAAQVVEVVLIDLAGVPVRLDGPERGGDEAGQAFLRIVVLLEHVGVGALQLVQIAGEDLVDHGLFGSEVVIEAAGEDAGRVTDLPHRRGRHALAGKQLARLGQNDLAAVAGVGHGTNLMLACY